MRSARRDVGSAPRPVPAAAAGAAPRPHRPAHPRDALLRLQRQYGNRRARGIIQAKLNVGPADDQFEREADRISRLATGSSVRRAPEAIRRVHGTTGGPADPAVAQVVARASGGGGRDVPSAVRERMARASGADFGGVRVHVDAESDRLNDALGSRAFTVGADVFVRRSEYRPGSARGDALLGHELTHTLQQGAAQPRSSCAPAVTTPVAQRVSSPTDVGADVEEDRGQPGHETQAGQGAESGSRAGRRYRRFRDRVMGALRRLGRRWRRRPYRDLEIPSSPAKVEAIFSADRGAEYSKKFGLPRMGEKLRKMGGPGYAEVDRKVHFIWLGDRRPLGSTERDNIRNWMEKAREADPEWEVQLWMDLPAAKKNSDFLDAADVSGRLTLRPVSDLEGHFAMAALEGAIERGAYTQASDILRLMLLSAEGGIYLDVDIAPGEDTLPSGLTMDLQGIPFFAPMMQNEENVKNVLESNRKYEELRKKYDREGLGEILAEYAVLMLGEEASFNNNFIIAARSMRFVDLLLRRIVELGEEEETNVGLTGGDKMSRLVARWQNNDTVGVTGYRLMQGEILRLLGVAPGGEDAWSEAVKAGLVAFDRERVQEWKKIGWITSASSQQ